MKAKPINILTVEWNGIMETVALIYDEKQLEDPDNNLVGIIRHNRLHFGGQQWVIKRYTDGVLLLSDPQNILCGIFSQALAS